MKPDETSIRKAVRAHYAELAQAGKAGESCCGQNLSSSDAAPPEASQIYAGCGSPVELAGIKEGEVVADLGSGGGFDAFKASRLVGETGRVIGVDATPEMIWRARETAKKYGVSNVDFRLGEIEHVPIDSSSVDVAISNCVINLAPDKGAVFREAYRVLKPGGRLVVSDTVAEYALKVNLQDLDAWAACVAGALPQEEYVALIKETGFTGVDIRRELPEELKQKERECCSTPGIASVTVTATKPKTG